MLTVHPGAVFCQHYRAVCRREHQPNGSGVPLKWDQPEQSLATMPDRAGTKRVPAAHRHRQRAWTRIGLAALPNGQVVAKGRRSSARRERCCGSVSGGGQLFSLTLRGCMAAWLHGLAWRCGAPPAPGYRRPCVNPGPSPPIHPPTPRQTRSTCARSTTSPRCRTRAMWSRSSPPAVRSRSLKNWRPSACTSHIGRY